MLVYGGAPATDENYNKSHDRDMVDKVDDSPTVQDTQEEPPFPPTRSPVTFAGLLPTFGEMALTREELWLIVEEMTPPGPRARSDASAGADAGGW